jgi:prepilin-type N-terminal cleavage/methylation domain-containing protein
MRNRALRIGSLPARRAGRRPRALRRAPAPVIRPRRGFTLAESIVSMAVSALLIGSVASSMVLVARSIPAADDRSVVLTELGLGLAPLLEDLAVATSFSERAATGVTFVVGDRTGDSAPDTLRYSWSGSAGGPLLQTINGGAARTILPAVQQFSLGYASLTVPQSPASPTTESAEGAQFSYDSVLTLARSVSDGMWYSQYFRPGLPNDTVSWRPTRVRLMLSQLLTVGNGINVQFRGADANGLPTTTILDTVPVPEATLALLPEAFDVPICAIAALPPGQGYCIVLTSSTSNTVSVLANSTASATSDCKLAVSTNGGSTWTAANSGALLLTVYGTVTSMTPNPPDKYYQSWVSVKVQSYGTAPVTMESIVQVLARPEVPTP